MSGSNPPVVVLPPVPTGPLLTAVPSPYIGPAGVVVPLEADVLTGTLADVNSSFGGFLNVDNLETPQGQLASSLAAIVADKNAKFAQLAAMFDPAYANGRYQEALGRSYYKLERIAASGTVVVGTVAGAPGAAVPLGYQAKARDTGNVYAALEGGVIGQGGSVDLSFTSLVLGAFPCAPGALAIYQSAPGVESVTNAAAGVPGTGVESRAAFEQRRRNAVALNSNGCVPSVYGAVLAVDGVLDASVFDNSKGYALVENGVRIPAHALYVCVVGGASGDVARAIFTKKAPGCDMAGNTTETVLDTTYNPPRPYLIDFDYATDVEVWYVVQLQYGPDVPADAQAQIAGAIAGAMQGLGGEAPARIGAQLFASAMVSPISKLGSWTRIVSITVGRSATDQAQTLALHLNEKPVTDPSTILVTAQ